MTLGPLSSVQWRLKYTPTVQRGSGRQQSCPTQVTNRSMAVSLHPPCGARATKSIFGIITPQPPEMWLNIAGGRTAGAGGAACVSAAPSVRSSGDEDECEKLEPSAMRFIPLARSSSFASMIAAPPQSSFTSDESVLLPRGTRFDLILHGDKRSPTWRTKWEEFAPR